MQDISYISDLVSSPQPAPVARLLGVVAQPTDSRLNETNHSALLTNRIELLYLSLRRNYPLCLKSINFKSSLFLNTLFDK